jgi:hypothetical protein
MNVQRRKLPTEIRWKRGLLIVDGHTSRECPIAFSLLDKANFDQLVLSSHLSHVLQMFDVGLAWPFKAKFAELFLKIEKNESFTEMPNVGKNRLVSVRTLISAWQISSCLENCRSEARATGIYPFDPERLMKSRFVHCLSQDEIVRFQNNHRKNRRLNINSCILTDKEKIDEVRSCISKNEKFPHFLIRPEH